MLCFWNVLFGRKHAQPTIRVRGLGGCIFTGSTSTIWNSAREVSSFSINSLSHVCVPADSQLLILHCWYSNITVAQMFSPLTTGRSLSWLPCSSARSLHTTHLFIFSILLFLCLPSLLSLSCFKVSWAPDWLKTHQLAKGDFEFLVLLPSHPESWDLGFPQHHTQFTACWDWI